MIRRPLGWTGSVLAIWLLVVGLASYDATAEPESTSSPAEAPPAEPATAPPATTPERDGAALDTPEQEHPPAGSEAAGEGDVYIPPPPDRLVPGGRTGGSTRGPESCPAEILALVPRDHVGLTSSPQPTLYWLLAEATACRIDFVLNDPRETRPRVEREIPGPHRAGIHALSLAELGVTLEPGLVYDWVVQVVPDPEMRSKDVMSGGQVERLEVAGDLPASSSDVARVRALGQAGLWYDALAALQPDASATAASARERAMQAQLLAAQGLELSTIPGGADIDVAAPPPARAEH